MIFSKRSYLIWRLAIPMGLLATVGFLVGLLADSDGLKSLRQHLPAEIIGVAASVLITVFYVDRLMNRAEARRWEPLRQKIYSAVRAHSEGALFMLNSYLHFAPAETKPSAIVQALLLFPMGSSTQQHAFASGVLAKDVEHIREILDQYLRLIFEITDRGKAALIESPTLLEVLIELETSFKMFSSAVNLGGYHLSQETPLSYNVTSTLEESYPLAPFPLTKVLSALAQAHGAATI